jgi:hypothetical protein
VNGIGPLKINKITDFGYLILGNLNKITSEQLINILNFYLKFGLLGAPVDTNTQNLINLLFNVVTKRPLDAKLPFDIKLDITTLIELGKKQ